MVLSPSLRASVGALVSLCLWSLGPVVTLFVDRLPVLEVLAINFAFCGLLTLIWILAKRRWEVLRQPLSRWLVGLLAISGTQIMYIHAFRYAPPVQVELINYLWPLLTLLCSGIVLHYPLKKGHLLAGLLSFTGLLALLKGDLQRAEILMEHGIGYLFAIGSALCWTSYTLLSRRFGKIPTEMLGLGCIISSPLCWCTHKLSETTIPPTSQEWFNLALMGLGISWTAYYLWDQGIKRGHFRSLNIASYLVPIVSVGWLMLFRFTSVTPTLLLACGLVTGGSLLCAWTDHRQLSIA